MESLVKVVLLTLGGAVGVNARYWLSYWINQWASPRFPWATFTINLTGSFLIGLMAVLLSRWLPHPHYRLTLLVGVLGGYTTFSSYVFEALSLMEQAEYALGIFYLAGSMILGLLAVTLGAALGHVISALG